MNHWPRCTTLRQVRDHFKDHPERMTRRGTFHALETGNRCALGMLDADKNGQYAHGAYERAMKTVRCGALSSLLIRWHDVHRCDPARWPAELASDEILDREWQ